ncbi:Fatty acid/phospholipid synthesis protein PlsX [Elusimicrobium minutum Pei191]|uniref:Phosphate acyltransferase n=1 Tax=Elusimicrobium minutum (strain Pei191) TaxID=445932 RepID=PLSX_ELUMP|nr:phosphate acyltransferase PlsX [Elusimicrobium minutum]B2KC86.1 RecName: Full=Phosphate acyltransferase; AltName: Full=Acyl-ACP phosphotransacylase; AltName: Full=Acyl-[acyl-carrier-protein]--phosphate acyltransferase; AltName: Full=Phosphate-acyl-ACP acyltransferase [Elusimicrobium minutum Pei191]ACC98213.1 Fatty acid/phospholipid synthesis protein PlsX [Elusimicrobium minutum Pei191]
MRIALDASGGDFGYQPNILGAARAVKELKCEVILVGDEKVLKEQLASLGLSDLKGLSVEHAPDVIDMDADPAKEVRSKKNASVVVAADLVKQGRAKAFVSAGNSGATMVAALMKMGRIEGVLRPAIGAPLPTVKGLMLLLDAGANAECKPQHLMQFAVMGSIYTQKVFGIRKPKVGLLSIGEEEGKGNDLVKETYPYLSNLGINFCGNVEGRDLPFGTTDVVVTDGFTGNVCLKLEEGLAKAMFHMIKGEIKKNPIAMLGAMLAKPAFASVKKITDPDTAGGAPLLGVDGVAIVSHGKSSETAVFNAVRTAKRLVDSGFVSDIKQHIAEYKEIFEKLEAKK